MDQINWRGENWLELSVTDDGMGMVSETQAKAINPYYTTKKDGTGLGLAIVHRIVTDHRGRMFLKSALKMGTTITILLPLQPDPINDH